MSFSISSRGDYNTAVYQWVEEKRKQRFLWSEIALYLGITVNALRRRHERYKIVCKRCNNRYSPSLFEKNKMCKYGITGSCRYCKRIRNNNSRNKTKVIE